MTRWHAIAIIAVVGLVLGVAIGGTTGLAVYGAILATAVFIAELAEARS